MNLGINKKNRTLKILLIFLYILPVFYIDSFSILLLLSTVSMLYIINYPNVQEDSMVLNKNKYTLIVLFSIGISYLLMYLFISRNTDNGIMLYEYNIIPTFTISIYYIIPIIWYKVLEDKSLLSIFKLNKKIIFGCILLMIPYMVVDIQRIIESSYLINNLPADLLLYDIYQAFFVAALMEETFFRGYLYTALKKVMKIGTAQITSAVVFALWHFSLLQGLVNNFSYHGIINLIAIFVLGIVTAKIFEKYKSIIPCIILHAVVNGAFRYFIMLIAGYVAF